MEKAAEKGEKVQNDGYKMMGKNPNAGAGQFLLAVSQSQIIGLLPPLGIACCPHDSVTMIL